MRERLSAVGATGGLGVEHGLDEVEGLGGDLVLDGGEVDLAVVVPHDDLVVGGALEGGLAGEKEEHEAAYAEDVDLVVVDAVLEHFRGDEARRAAALEHVVAEGVVNVGEAEIGDHDVVEDPLGAEDHVFGLEVAVQYVLGMEVFDRVQ